MLLNNLHHLFISGRCRSRAASNLAAAIVRATSHLGGRIAANLAARITADLRRRQLVKLDGAVGILEAAAWSYTSCGVYGVIPDGILLVVGVHHHCTVAVVDTLKNRYSNDKTIWTSSVFDNSFCTLYKKSQRQPNLT